MSNLKEITELALRAGAIVSESAGETYRVEETMRRIGNTLGADEAMPYATPTGLFLSCQRRDENNDVEIVTRMKRLKKYSTNLGKIAEINTLSRKIAVEENVDLEDFSKKLDQVERDEGYKPIPTIFVTALSAFCFSIMFSGTIKDSIIAFCVSLLMKTVLYAVSKLKLSSFIFTIIGSTVVSFTTGVLFFCGVSMSFDIVNIATLMALMPGVAIVIAIRDIIAGDYISGGGRATDAFVTALSISLGASAGLLLFPSIMEYNTSMAMLPDPLLAFLSASGASACFAFIFQVKKVSNIIWAAIAGGVSWAMYIVLTNNGVAVMTAFIVSSFCVGVISEIFAFWLKEPATIFVIPALISFVPGGGMYATMYKTVLGLTNDAMMSLFSTLSVAGAIALGIAFASGCARFLTTILRRAKAKQLENNAS